MVFTVEVWVLGVYNKDEKKHIWFLILIDLLVMLFQLKCIMILLFYLFIEYMKLYNGLLQLLEYLNFLWIQMIAFHMAHMQATVNIQHRCPIMV